MALSTLFQFWAVKKLYQPIASIKEVFEQSRFADGTAKEEFTLIRQVYEGALNQIQTLEKESARNLPHMKSTLLRELITGSMDARAAGQRLKELGIEIPFPGMFLVCFLIDEPSDNRLLLNVIQSRLCQLLPQKLGNLFYVECVPVGSHEVVGLINTKDGSGVTFDELVASLEQLRGQLLSDYDCHLTAALDGVLKDYQDCPAFYVTAHELLRNRFSLGEDQVIYPARAADLLPRPLAYPDKLIRDIENALKQSNSASYQENIDLFIDTITQYDYKAASLLFAQLYLELAAQIQQFDVPGTGGGAYLEMKMNPATPKEARELLLNLYKAFENSKNEREQLKGNRHYKTIMASRQFISEHYSDSSLSVDLIAEQFGYSSNYYARLFKTITGYYVNDYIRQLRIARAQELLLNTDKTIEEIAEETGFSTSNYFYTVFKKETGLTPTAYRNG